MKDMEGGEHCSGAPPPAEAAPCGRGPLERKGRDDAKVRPVTIFSAGRLGLAALLAALVLVSALLGGTRSLSKPGAPWIIALSIPAGALLLVASLAFTSLSLRKALVTGPAILRRGLGPAGFRRRLTLHYLVVSFVEELFWRASVQPLIADPRLGVPLVAAVFTLLHCLEQRRRLRLLWALDLFGFALVLGLVFQLTGSLYAVALLHFVRNRCLAELCGDAGPGRSSRCGSRSGESRGADECASTGESRNGGRKKMGIGRVAGIAVVAVAVLWLLSAIAAYLLQERLIYMPDREVPPPERLGLTGCEDVRIATEDGVRLHGWFLAPPAGRPPAALVLQFHGNAGNIVQRAWKLDLLARSGLASLVFDYRGYGRSEGRPSEAGLYADGRAAVRLARERALSLAAAAGGGRRALPVVYYGESLGCAVAIEMALEDPPPAGLVLDAPFTSLAAVGRYHLPWLPAGLLLRARFDNLGKIGRVRVPLLVIHGERDCVIPISMGRTVFDAASAAPAPRRFVAIPGADHADRTVFESRPLIDGIREMIAAFGS